MKRIQKLSEKLSDPALAERARKINSNTFSRNRKMPLKDILLCCLSKKGLTTTLELRNYFIQKDVPSMKIKCRNKGIYNSESVLILRRGIDRGSIHLICL